MLVERLALVDEERNPAVLEVRADVVLVLAQDGGDHRAFSVSLALRSLDAEEQRASARERELASAADEERKEQAYGEQSKAKKFSSLRDALGVGEDVGLDDTLEHKGLVSRAQAALAEAMRAEAPQPPDVGALFVRLADLNTQRAARVEGRQTQQTDADRKGIEAERLRSEASHGEFDIGHGRVRVCSICRVPVDEVLAKGCGISLERCDVESIRRAIAEKQNQAAELDQASKVAELEASRITAVIHQIDQEIKTIEAQAQGADTALRLAQQKAATIQDRVYRARRLFDDARALQKSTVTTRPAPTATDEMETVRQQIGLVAVWCRSFDSVMCNKGDEPWAQSGRMSFARTRCGLR